MKLLVTAAVSFLFTGALLAQPVISDGSKMPAPGFSAAVSAAMGGSIGNPGADQVWDFSAISFTPVGMMTVIDPATSPYASSYPDADYAYSFANTYTYVNTTAEKSEVAAYSITAPGSGADMSPNPRSVLSYPFTFGSSVTDTWQKVGSNPNEVTITYDGYGTLITPTTTYQNVVRVKESYGDGDDYQWYITDPLISIMVYDHNTNAFYHTAAAPKAQVAASRSLAASVYPNPADRYLKIDLTGIELPHGATITIMDVAGRKLQTRVLTNAQTTLSIEHLNAGSYLYEIRSAGNVIKRGSVSVR